ncbi:hypothetical protein BJ878DRAFT_214019 [Calycina marina]|uniref:Uncharacterized protein n=1 Tax=Calycina marina TaxID=1763456 RepID=A0A9P8CHV9_9HELO|nr:hypothetical protein BJ878DRAFT_214019 [Calycina marina]
MVAASHASMPRMWQGVSLNRRPVISGSILVYEGPSMIKPTGSQQGLVWASNPLTLYYSTPLRILRVCRMGNAEDVREFPSGSIDTGASARKSGGCGYYHTGASARESGVADTHTLINAMWQFPGVWGGNKMRLRLFGEQCLIGRALHRIHTIPLLKPGDFHLQDVSLTGLDIKQTSRRLSFNILIRPPLSTVRVCHFASSGTCP